MTEARVRAILRATVSGAVHNHGNCAHASAEGSEFPGCFPRPRTRRPVCRCRSAVPARIRPVRAPSPHRASAICLVSLRSAKYVSQKWSPVLRRKPAISQGPKRRMRWRANATPLRSSVGSCVEALPIPPPTGQTSRAGFAGRANGEGFPAAIPRQKPARAAPLRGERRRGGQAAQLTAIRRNRMVLRTFRSRSKPHGSHRRCARSRPAWQRLTG